MLKLSFSNIKSMAKVAKVVVVKHSPEILMGTGTVAFIATIVTASRATIKAQDILEDHREALEDIKLVEEMTNNEESTEVEYTKEDARKDKIVQYSKTGLALAKEYALPLGLAALTISCYFGAFGIMKKRYTTLAAAYSALNTAFQKYRQRVIEDKGEEKDLEYLTGGKVKEITQKDENGNKTKLKALTLPDGTVLSPYAFKFGKYKENGEINHQWQGDYCLDKAYILGQQDYLNDQLYLRCVFDDQHRVLKRGCVFLNEIRDLLGEDPTATGAVAGNRYGNGEPGCDGFIDFHLIEAQDENGLCFYVNPNIDGLIYDLVDKWEKEPFVPTYGID